MPDDSFTKWSMESYQKAVNNCEIPVEKYVKLLASRPAFSDAPNGYMIAICNHTVIELLQEQNINMVNGVNVHIASLPVSDININGLKNETPFVVSTGTILQEQESINLQGSSTLLPIQNEAQKREQVLRVAEPKKSENVDTELLNWYVKISLRLALSVLYKGRFVPEDYITIAKQFIYEYYYSKLSKRRLTELNSDFNIVIFEAYKAQTRKFYMPAPMYLYFDPYFTGGFYNTLKHVETYVKPYIEKNKEYSKSISEVMKLYAQYSKTKDYETYRKATQFLGKKKNKEYLNFFNQCVEEPKTFTNTVFLNQWNNHVNKQF